MLPALFLALAPQGQTIIEPTPLVTQSVWAEPFAIAEPTPLPTTPQPLLIVFHEYKRTYQQVLQSTGYPQECANRGWFMLAPTGAIKENFAFEDFHWNVEAALDWVLAQPQYQGLIDMNRIYTVGFSMGGNCAMNYAARHLDPNEPMIAASASLSGGLSIRDTYRWHGKYKDDAWRLMNFIFGKKKSTGPFGTAGAWPLKMSASSSVDFEITQPGTFDPLRTLHRNLAHVARYVAWYQIETVIYVPEQNVRFGLSNPGGTYDTLIVPTAVPNHTWDIVPAVTVCDWLALRSLSLPTAGSIVAVEDKRYLSFEVRLTNAGIASFDWDFNAQANTLSITNTSNLRRVIVRGLVNPQQTMYVDVEGLTILDAVSQVPQTVLRNGAPAIQGLDWDHSAAAGLLLRRGGNFQITP